MFPRKAVDPSRHTRLLADIQRLRGVIYVHDGAIDSAHLSADGRHLQVPDDTSWHITMLDEIGKVGAALRYSPQKEGLRFEDLRVAQSALAKTDAQRLRQAVQSVMSCARQRGLGFAEFGGWVLTPKLRASTAAACMIATGYAIAQHHGGSLAIGTATTRHGSASMLRRIGGKPLKWNGTDVPSYFDPQHRCEMEILQFDSGLPNAVFAPHVHAMMAELRGVRVFCRADARPKAADTSPGVAA